MAFRNIAWLLLLLPNVPLHAMEPSVLYLEPDESAAHMLAQDDTLAIGASDRERYVLGKNVAALKNSSGVVLIRENAPPLRTSFEPGTIRALVAIPSGFVVARAAYDSQGKGIADFFSVNLKGEATAMQALLIDLIGLWMNAQEVVFAYSSRSVFRWSAANLKWEQLSLDSAVNSEAIRKIVSLKDGSALVVTDHVLKGFKDLCSPPIFVKDLRTYPKPINAYGDDQWWIVTSDAHTQKLSRVRSNGQVNEITTLTTVNVHDLLFGGDKVFVVCAREGGNVHKCSYYILNRDGTGSMRGPFMLPDDTMTVCLWKNAIVSGGASNRIFKTEIGVQPKGGASQLPTK